ncbi:MAG: c-type cytochrome [Dongiaceae bacterium]
MIADEAAAADDELGAYLAESCASCHQPDVRNGPIPAITGLDEARFVSLIRAYRSGERPDSIMQAVAGSLSDEETVALAHFLATRSDQQ